MLPHIAEVVTHRAACDNCGQTASREYPLRRGRDGWLRCPRCAGRHCEQYGVRHNADREYPAELALRLRRRDLARGLGATEAAKAAGAAKRAGQIRAKQLVVTEEDTDKENDMGDIADMMLDGLLDSETGELIDGEAPGHPRTLRRLRKAQQRQAKPHQCSECGKRFATDQGLKDHCKAKHASLPPD